MKYTLVIAALLGVQAIQLTDPSQVGVDRFEEIYDDQMSAFMKE